MRTPRGNRAGKTRRRIVAIAAVGLLAGLLGTSSASANLPGSTFEGGDGNFVVNTLGNTDWAALNATQQANLSVQPDLLSGQTDNSFGNGTKTSDINVTVVSGQIPNNKADLGNSYITSETLANGDVMLYLGVTRVTTSGTVNLDIEVNQAAQPDLTTPGPKVLNRTVDDLLIGYDFQGGSQRPTLTFRTWTGSAWTGPTAIGAANGEAEVNRVALANPLAVPPSPATAPAFTFGEAAINLTGLGIIPEGECAPFSSAYVKSRASDAFTSAVKDFIAPQAINLDTCGSITIVKQTDPDGAADLFDFTLTGPGPTDEAFSLSDGQSNTTPDLRAGTYVATEVGLPEGWDFDTATCDDGSDPAAIDLGIDEDVICTFNNVARANLHIVKVAERDGVDFSFTADPPLDPASFTLQNGGQQDFGPLVPGTYGTAETVPEGWTLESATCDNGDAPAAVTLGPGDDVTCTYTNVIERGALSIHKTAKHAAAPGGTINHGGVTFTVTNATNGTSTQVVTDSSGNACVSDLPVSFLDGDYTITETVPAGYHAVDPDQTYTVVEGTDCGSAMVASFVNIPLTNITMSVDSQIDGGTASTIDCVLASGSTGANGDGSVTVNDLEPGTYSCEVVIDP
jgi:Prealbumin-like fold domain